MDFIACIDNWAICDSFCSNMKIVNKRLGKYWMYFISLIDLNKEFQTRVSIVMMMNYYLTDSYIDLVLEQLDGIKHEAYYVKMAVAWALATALAKQPEKTWAYLQNHHLDEDTWRKTVQKCMESYRISEEYKAILRQMRRDLAKQKHV
jgi:3-methyladenine DNA glycosylase AlkD